MSKIAYIEESDYSEEINELLKDKSPLSKYRFLTICKDGAVWIWEDFPICCYGGTMWLSGNEDEYVTDGGMWLGSIDGRFEACKCHYDIKRAPICEDCGGNGNPCVDCDGMCSHDGHSTCEYSRDEGDAICKECHGAGYIEEEEEAMKKFSKSRYMSQVKEHLGEYDEKFKYLSIDSDGAVWIWTCMPVWDGYYWCWDDGDTSRDYNRGVCNINSINDSKYAIYEFDITINSEEVKPMFTLPSKEELTMDEAMALVLEIKEWKKNNV